LLTSKVIAGLRHAQDPWRPESRFLRHASGVIHVGANTGQERFLYRLFGLRVIWVEPIPEVFARLSSKIARFSKQRAIQSLVTDRDDQEYEFHVASNNGASSSILDFDQHKDIWPEVTYERTIALRSKTLASLVRDEGIDLDEYDALVIDTQGSELLVLEGAEPILEHFTYVKAEVPDFESYAGCCKLEDVEAFLTARGFAEHVRQQFAERSAGGSYYDVVYKREER
jgi:FkbM family methyltransferase